MERRGREAREGRTREDRAPFDFPPFLRPATQATPEPANFLILFPFHIAFKKCLRARSLVARPSFDNPF